MKRLPLLAAIVLGLSAPAFAQQIAPNTLSGNECWNAGQGPGGPSTGFVCAFMLRNTTALNIFTGTGAVTTQATSAMSTLMWHSTAPTSWTITTPVSPQDGEILSIGTDTTLTSMVTLTAASGQSLSATYTSQTLTAATSIEWQYNLASTTWYRVR